MNDQITKILGSDADGLLRHECRTISKDVLHLPGPTFIDDVMSASDRSPTVLRNLRAGGTGLITGRKAFQRPMSEGVQLLNAVQDVYLDKDITVA
jgi:hypothetical protein